MEAERMTDAFKAALEHELVPRMFIVDGVMYERSERLVTRWTPKDGWSTEVKEVVTECGRV